MAENPYEPLPVSSNNPSGIARSPDQLPPVMDLVKQMGDRFMKDPVRYLGGGALVFVDLVIGSVLMLPAVGMFVVGTNQHGDSGLLFVALGTIGLLVVTLGIMGFTAAVQGAAFLSLRDEMNEGEKFSFGAVSSRLGAGLWIGLPAILLTQVLVMTGMSFCYFPAFFVIAFVLMMIPAMVDREVGAFAALGLCWARFKAAPGWHFRLMLADVLVTMVASMVPLVGIALMIPVRGLLLTLGWRAVRDLEV